MTPERQAKLPKLWKMLVMMELLLQKPLMIHFYL
jgi:hypothetical protein